MKQHGLGKSLQKKSSKHHDFNEHMQLPDTFKETDTGLSSVIETNDLSEFLNRAELLGASFEAEKDTFEIINSTKSGVLSKVEMLHRDKLHVNLNDALRIPRRPKWTTDMTVEELETAEKESFVVWRECMSRLERAENVLMTPYEKNLDFWRQLWRVVEKSDLVVQIVDARNPLFFYSDDLVQYVKEIDNGKATAVLVNKADLLTDDQIVHWKQYFEQENVNAYFWSALSETCPSSQTLSADDLLTEFQKLCSGDRNQQVIGLIGFPNVGKSSTVNALIKVKKVAVSATPGRTKHFQTIHLSDKLILCDCPGLVLPQFVYTKSDLVINGVLPIDNMRDFIGPVELICRQIPREKLAQIYSLHFVTGDEESNRQTPLTAMELLTTHSKLHGFVTSKGQPHLDRSARLIIKDYVRGDKLVFCHAPPNCNTTPEQFNSQMFDHLQTTKTNTELSDKIVVLTDFDRQYFAQREPGFGYKDKRNLSDSKKHHKKKEKLRRVHRDLDNH